MNIAWTKSEDGYCESKDGRFRIEPIFNHSVAPAGYNLYDNGERVKRSLDTQKEAKELAERRTK